MRADRERFPITRRLVGGFEAQSPRPPEMLLQDGEPTLEGEFVRTQMVTVD